MAANVVIFVEDPGAALFMKGLPAALRKGAAHPHVVAGPFAAPYFVEEATMPLPAETGASGATDLLSNLAADILVVGTSENPDSFAFDLVHAARARGISSFAAVDSAPNAELRFRGHSSSPLTHMPDSLLLSDQSSRAAYAQLGVAEERMTVCGHPQLHAISNLSAVWDDRQRQEHRARWFPDVPPDRPIFVFVSELSVGLGDNPFRRTADYRLLGTSGSDARGDIVAEEFIRAARGLASQPHLVLRLHPKQRLSDEQRLASLFDQVSQGEPALEVVHAADLVVGMNSILLAEASTLGRPVLSIVPRPVEREWLGDMAATIPCVWEADDIAERLLAPEQSTAASATSVDPADVMADRVLSAVGILQRDPI